MVVGAKMVKPDAAGGEGIALLTRAGNRLRAPWRGICTHTMPLEPAALHHAHQDQAALGASVESADWYVEYEAAGTDEGGLACHRGRRPTSRAYQDVFQLEFGGVQIMSPTSFAQPGQAVLVAREHWYQAPAEARATQQRGKAPGK